MTGKIDCKEKKMVWGRGVFVPGKLHQPGLMVVGRARTLTQECRNLKGASLRLALPNLQTLGLGGKVFQGQAL
jgi:hypothetical protein